MSAGFTASDALSIHLISMADGSNMVPNLATKDEQPHSRKNILD